MAELKVEVCYANESRQKLLSVIVPESSSVAKTIIVSGILDEFPEIDLQKVKVGIFSKQVAMDHLVRNGDRIEIYRPLQVQPNQARLKRARRS